MKRPVFICLAFILLSVSAHSQVTSGLLKTLTSIAGIRERQPLEKLYLQLDKPYYALGDTLRFKAYLVNGDFLKPSKRSGLLYVELDDNTNKCIKRIMTPLSAGLSWGDLALTDKDFPEGSYTLRAYTNWMLNFGEDYVFKKTVNISALSGSTLVKADFKADKNKISASLRFTGLDKNPQRLKDMQLWVMNGRHTLIRDKASTGIDGAMDVNFDLPDNTGTKDLSIRAQEIRKAPDQAPMLVIPVTLNRPENTDVQFMPEGGSLVAGINTRIGFKAISEDGKATEISGRIINSKGEEQATIKTAHKGMGSFELVPKAGETYTAKVSIGKTTKDYPLPAVSPTGTTLRINPKGKDSLEITITTTPTLTTAPTTTTPYYLIGQTRGMICYTATITGSTYKKTIAKALFPTGIAHFTLLGSASQALNERIVYIDRNNNLQITITPNQTSYTTRDSIALHIQVKDNAGKPVSGHFSLAVTDDSQVRTDSTGNNIISDLLVTSDLKGTVEDPGWYFEKNTADRTAAIDNLLLTQGWVGYDWKATFDPNIQPPKYQPEPEFIVQGKVTNVLNKPVENSNVVLFSRKPELVRETMTDKEGKFQFKGLFSTDTAEFKVQARNKGGKSFNVGIEMDGFMAPKFEATNQTIPWYVNSDTVSLSNSSTKAKQQQAQAVLRGEGHLLTEVKINEKKIVKQSHNLNGPGEADQVFDEQDMLKAGKMTLGDLLKEKVKGFNVGMSPPVNLKMVHPSSKGGIGKPSRLSYRVNDKEMCLIFDGIDVDHVDIYEPEEAPIYGDKGRLRALQKYLDFYTAEDIKGIEIMFNTRYNSSYGNQLLPTDVLADQKYPIEADWSFIEITTRAGKGPYMRSTAGTYLYKPLPFTIPKDFYRPRYTVKNANSAIGTDLRSTIHWEPRVVTDKDGKATVSFFSADKAAGYTAIIEGSDLNGSFGYSRQKIKVTKAIVAK